MLLNLRENILITFAYFRWTICYFYTKGLTDRNFLLQDGGLHSQRLKMLLLLDREAVKPEKNEKHDSYFCSSVSRFLLLSFLIISDTIWSRTRNLQNKELEELAASLPEVVLAAKAESTTTTYQRANLVGMVQKTEYHKHSSRYIPHCNLL